MGHSFMRVAMLVACVTLCAPPRLLAATPFEAQIGGFMAAVLHTLISGEFAGRRTSQVDADLHRRVCRPTDYADLRAAANDTKAFDAFHQRCKLTEGAIDSTHVHRTAYLPAGYCETLKAAFETALAEQVHAGPKVVPGDYVVIEYKGSRYIGTRRTLARRARLQAACRDDGSLRVSAPRKRTSTFEPEIFEGQKP